MSSGLPLDALAADIKARVAAGDKAGQKQEEHYKSAGLHLIEARDRLKTEHKGMAWTVWVREKLGGEDAVGISRTYELIDIGSGKKTLAEVRMGTAERVAKHAAKRKSEVPLANGKSDDPARATLLDAWKALGKSLTNDQLEAEIHRIKGDA